MKSCDSCIYNIVRHYMYPCNECNPSLNKWRTNKVNKELEYQIPLSIGFLMGSLSSGSVQDFFLANGVCQETLDNLAEALQQCSVAFYKRD